VQTLSLAPCTPALRTHSLSLSCALRLSRRRSPSASLRCRGEAGRWRGGASFTPKHVVTKCPADCNESVNYRHSLWLPTSPHLSARPLLRPPASHSSRSAGVFEARRLPRLQPALHHFLLSRPAEIARTSLMLCAMALFSRLFSSKWKENGSWCPCCLSLTAKSWSAFKCFIGTLLLLAFYYTNAYNNIWFVSLVPKLFSHEV
jgi:hypothetical protein